MTPPSTPPATATAAAATTSRGAAPAASDNQSPDSLESVMRQVSLAAAQAVAETMQRRLKRRFEEQDTDTSSSREAIARLTMRLEAQEAALAQEKTKRLDAERALRVARAELEQARRDANDASAELERARAEGRRHLADVKRDLTQRIAAMLCGEDTEVVEAGASAPAAFLEAPPQCLVCLESEGDVRPYRCTSDRECYGDMHAACYANYARRTSGRCLICRMNATRMQPDEQEYDDYFVEVVGEMDALPDTPVSSPPIEL